MRPAHDLAATARRLVGSGKGILAADETPGTLTKRFQATGIRSTPESRRAYRELLCGPPELPELISGVILQAETFGQQAAGTPFPRFLAERGILPGIKVDTGSKPLAGAPGEEVTEGLDGLRERVSDYVAAGARFAKWRAVIRVGDRTPTSGGYRANAHALARYAALCQEGGLVPVVEPEVMMDSDHSAERCFEVTAGMLGLLFAELAEQGVALEALVLKPNMVVAGESCPVQATVSEVGELTLSCLRRTVPPAVPGIAFLSGGQGPVLATRHLDAMSRRGPHPWELSYSFARALQEPALLAWKGEPANVVAAQRALVHRCRCNRAARVGAYRPELDVASPARVS